MNSGSQSFLKGILLLLTLNAAMIFVYGLLESDTMQTTEDGLQVPSFGRDYMKQDIWGVKAWARENTENKMYSSPNIGSVVYSAIEASVNFLLFLGLFFKMIFMLLFGAGVYEGYLADGTTVGLFIASILNLIVIFVNIFAIRELFRLVSNK